MTLRGRDSDFAHFTDKETVMVSNTSKVTQLGEGGVKTGV